MQIELAPWETHKSKLREIREEVFVKEQNVSIDEEWDEYDEAANTIHLLAYAHEQHVGCIRIIKRKDNSAKISRLAVLKEYRGQDIGSALLTRAVDLALHQKPANIYLNAQVSALAFYEKHGFKSDGEVFDEAGIAHQKMFLKHSDASTLKALYNRNVIRLDSPSRFSQHLSQQTILAHRNIDILSTDLDRALYASAHNIECFSKFARNNRHAKIRILLEDSRQLIGRTHKLLALAQRLSSKFEIRRLQDDVDPISESYALFDRSGIVYFNDERNFIGFSNYSDGPNVLNLREKFENLWAHNSEIDPNLSQLIM